MVGICPRGRRNIVQPTLAIILLSMLTAGLFVGSFASVRAETFGMGDTVIVNTDALNLRSGAALSASVLRVLSGGTSLTVTSGPKPADGYTWYGVTAADGTTGWAAGEYLATGTDTTWNGGFGAGDTAVVDTARLNCRSGPALSYGVVYVLSGEETVQVLDGPRPADGYHWFKIKTDEGLIGWVIGEGLRQSSDGNNGNNGGFQFNDVVTVADGPLNVRSAAGLDAKAIGQLSQDAPACILNGPVSKDGYTWYLVFYGENSKGWVAGEFLAPA